MLGALPKIRMVPSLLSAPVAAPDQAACKQQLACTSTQLATANEIGPATKLHPAAQLCSAAQVCNLPACSVPHRTTFCPTHNCVARCTAVSYRYTNYHLLHSPLPYTHRIHTQTLKVGLTPYQEVAIGRPTTPLCLPSTATQHTCACLHTHHTYTHTHSTARSHSCKHTPQGSAGKQAVDACVCLEAHTCTHTPHTHTRGPLWPGSDIAD